MATPPKGRKPKKLLPPRDLSTRDQMMGIARNLWRRVPDRARTSTCVEDSCQDGYVAQLEGRWARYGMIDALPQHRPVAVLARTGERRGTNGKRVFEHMELRYGVPVFAERGQSKERGHMTIFDLIEVDGHGDRVNAAIDATRLLAPFPRRDQEMAVLRWMFDVELHKIGARYGLTESRVCQRLAEMRRDILTATSL